MACSGDTPELREGSLEQWKAAWENGKAVWQVHHVNVALKRNIHRLKIENSGDPKILLPLCGKTRDIKWLWEQGFTVVGVEVSEIAIKDFFAENDIKYEVSQIKGCPGVLYRSTDDRILLRVSSNTSGTEEHSQLFLNQKGGNNFVAYHDINHTRYKYASAISELMSDNCKMLLETLEKNIDVDPGQPPFDFQEPEMRQHFNQQFELEQIDQIKIDEYIDPSDERYFAYTRVSGSRIYLITKTSV
ncbi:hypothetical protein KUTeg_021277 [Tegillarca granosa]|uniref:Thiopurine S-methyltransferase n=1 Tax=Tegillarca granosa TaxID=220873 RepID=A0ABQ9EFK4_TEGGR|nr:hypothetical protein KUTeg_021277 [Tegillarca granosa]